MKSEMKSKLNSHGIPHPFLVFIICGLLLFTIPPLGFGLWVLYIIYMYMSRRKKEQPNAGEESLIEIIDEVADQPVYQDRYEVPTLCPVCGSKLRLDTIKWLDNDTGLCPKCESIVQAS